MARFDITDTAISAIRFAVAEICGDLRGGVKVVTDSPSNRSSSAVRADQWSAPSTVNVERAW